MELKSTKSTNMRYIINERQYRLLVEEEQEILQIPSLEVFGNWETLQKFLKRRGNPLYSIGGNLDLSGTNIKSLRNLTSVGGNLDLFNSSIKSLGNLTSVGGFLDLRYCKNLTSLGNLTSVGGAFNLYKCENLTSLGNLTSVGVYLNLTDTPISKKYSRDEIRDMVDIGDELYL